MRKDYVATCPDSFTDEVVLQIIKDMVQKTESSEKSFTTGNTSGSHSMELLDCSEISIHQQATNPRIWVGYRVVVMIEYIEI